MIIEWLKDCKCDDATAHAPGVTMTHEWDGDFANKVVVTFTPGPVCDRCGKAWKRVKDSNAGAHRAAVADTVTPLVGSSDKEV